MHKYFLIFSLLITAICLPNIVFSQWSDDFSTNTLDGSEWSGDLEDFIITDENILRLMASDGGSSSLFHTVNFFDENVWTFKMKMDFSPSNSNKTRVYLMAKIVGGIITDGIYLDMGESGNDDAINLFKLDNGVSTQLIFGNIGSIASEPVDVHIKVERRSSDIWRLSVDYTNSGIFIFEAETTDSFYPINIVDGLQINLDYTSTRTDKFYFDDFVSAQYTLDVEGPQIVNYSVLDENNLRIIFDEPISTSTLDISQFELTGSIQPISLSIISPTTIELEFNEAFTPSTLLTLTLSNIADIEGNTSISLSQDFTYEPVNNAVLYDILINEIMADPSPVLALPECEYIELFNPTLLNFNLENYTIESGGAPKTLPSFILEAGAYVLIVKSECADLYDTSIDIIGLSTFPALSNSGDFIILRNNNGQLINGVTYTDDWYNDTNKDDGGWSLELINPNKPCLINGNWTAASSFTGGTPGMINSVIDDSEDNDGPELISILPLNSQEIELTFSESLTQQSIVDLDQYSISDGLTVLTANLLVPQYNKVSLLLDSPLEEGIIYTLDLGGIEDCIGNEMNQITTEFGLASPPLSGECLINEILFDPYTGSNEFIEFYNNSDHIINLNDMIFVANDNVISLPEYILLPSSYVVLSDNALSLYSDYEIEDPTTLVSLDIPSFTNKEGNVILYATSNPSTAVDSFFYREKMHLDFITDTKGVSLERSSFTLGTNDSHNWHSAASESNFATPGYVNSQFIGDETLDEETFTLRFDSFSPNQDGYRDYLIIDYKLPSSDNVITMDIYNSEGYPVKKMAENKSLSNEGFLTWDGLDDDLLHFGPGIYILTITGVSLESNKTFNIKLPFVLALSLK